MADISKINVKGVNYDIKDATARESVETLESGKADNATTLAGYGITDAYTKTEVDAAIAAKSIDMDATMSDSSTNAVQNKVIKTYVDAQDAKKQDALTTAQLNATNSGITADKVNTYDGYATSKQDALSTAQLAAVNSGITATKVATYDGYAATINQKANASDVYTQTEVDNKLSALNTGLDWKESVATYDDIATTYASPEDGWTVNVQDTDVTYRYTGSEWIAISANSIPMADASTDGKMSSAHYTKVENLTMSVSGETLTLAE